MKAVFFPRKKTAFTPTSLFIFWGPSYGCGFNLNLMKSVHILSGNFDTVLSAKIESVFLARSQLAQASKVW